MIHDGVFLAWLPQSFGFSYLPTPQGARLLRLPVSFFSCESVPELRRVFPLAVVNAKGAPSACRSIERLGNPRGRR